MDRTAVLSTRNLIHNLNIIKSKAHGKKIIAMVKANAYGHGLRSVSARLQQHVDMLGVASIDEAVALRKSGIIIPILLCEGVFKSSDLLLAAVEGFHVVFHTKEQIDWLDEMACMLPSAIHSWLKIDTGMGRLGVRCSEALEQYLRLLHNKKTVKPVHVLSHLACAGNKEHAFNMQQIAKFDAIATKIRQYCNDAAFSLCSSAGVWNFPDYCYDYIRPGLALYGVSPVSGCSASDLGLSPVMTLYSKMIAIKMMKRGESVGYNALYRCPQDMPIGIVAFGYGDGYPVTTIDNSDGMDGTDRRDGRDNKNNKDSKYNKSNRDNKDVDGNNIAAVNANKVINNSFIMLNKIRCPIIGRVSMDMLAIDLRNCLVTDPATDLTTAPLAKIKVGDQVVLWGDGLPIEEIAHATGVITWSLLAAVQNRVKFIWTRDL